METPRGVVPYLAVQGAADAVAFYARAFGAVEVMRIGTPDGTVVHAELRIGDATFMLAEAMPQMGNVAPPALGGTPVTLHVVTEDVDAAVARAVEAGATLRAPVETRFYGFRVGAMSDPFGHAWEFEQQVEVVPPEEVARRAAAMFGG